MTIKYEPSCFVGYLGYKHIDKTYIYGYLKYNLNKLDWNSLIAVENPPPIISFREISKFLKIPLIVLENNYRYKIQFNCSTNKLKYYSEKDNGKLYWEQEWDFDDYGNIISHRDKNGSHRPLYKWEYDRHNLKKYSYNDKYIVKFNYNLYGEFVSFTEPSECGYYNIPGSADFDNHGVRLKEYYIGTNNDEINRPTKNHYNEIETQISCRIFEKECKIKYVDKIKKNKLIKEIYSNKRYNIKRSPTKFILKKQKGATLIDYISEVFCDYNLNITK
jgi:hypothetical protein